MFFEASGLANPKKRGFGKKLRKLGNELTEVYLK